MNAQHTPGPWEQRGKFIYATGSVDTWTGPVVGSIASCEETVQTDGEGRTWSVNGDAKANARLIAASPDMLSALLAVYEWQEADGDDEIAAEAARVLVIAALAKATGEAAL